MDRRTSHLVNILTAIALAGLLPGQTALAQDGAAVLAPFDGSTAIIGRSIAAAVEGELAGKVKVMDDGCTLDTAAGAARDVLAAGAALVIGLPCIDAFDGAAPILAAAGVPVLAVGLQAADVTQPPPGSQNWPIFRIGPRQDQEWAVLARFIADHWRNENFAIIDDGTLYGRRLAENVRLLLTESALEPVFIDTYRPLLDDQMALVQRLRRSGATHVIVGGEAFDAAIIGADAERAGYHLVIAGGSMLRAPPSDGRLPDGTVLAAIPQRTDLAAIAAQIGRQALAADHDNPLASLRTAVFETDAGPIRFDAHGEPDRQFFTIHQVRNGRALPLAEPNL